VTPQEITALRALCDELVQATDTQAWWLGRVRATAEEIQTRLADADPPGPPPAGQEPAS